MRSVRHGVQETSRQSSISPSRSTPLALTLIGALALAVLAWTAPAAAAGDYLLMPRSELLSRPVSGTAWSNLKSVAAGSLGTANLCDQNEDHHLRTLAAALVYARTGEASYGSKARSGVMAAIKTQTPGCGNAVLALGRQLTAYVLAADFANLSGDSDTTFRTWLKAIRTKNIGGHSVWNSLSRTHALSANNWGAYAGAARIAASRYLGDTTDLNTAARITQGFLGDRTKYASFAHKLSSTDLSWSCASATTYTPENKACTKNGINVDGAFIADISRGGGLTWPPGGTGISYQLESIQGMGLQVELLYRAGFTSAWSWSSKAMHRAGAVVTRSKASGGTGWNSTQAARQMPWLLNKRYGTKIPTTASGMGRGIGFTDWLWGGGSSTSNPTATPKPTTTPKPTATPTPPPGDAPVAKTPSVRLSTSSGVPTSGVPVVVAWGLSSSDDPIGRYTLQVSVDGGSYVTRALSSNTATSYRMTLTTGHDYTFRVRPIDRVGRVGAWKTAKPMLGVRVDDSQSSVTWAGSWSTAALSSYIAGKTHWTNANGATAKITFSGTQIAWVGPVGPTRGQAKVYLDGTYLKTVDLKASSFQARKLLFATSVGSGQHVLTIRGSGTSGRPTVAVDAFYVVRPD